MSHLGQRAPFLALGIAASAAKFLAGAAPASAADFAIRPISFIQGADFSVVATGGISVNAAGLVTDWSLQVTTTERLARYTPLNTRNFSSGPLGSDGGSLYVGASPDGVQDGGALYFRSPSPFSDFGVSPANFTSAFGTGQAFYSAGAAFDFRALNQAFNTNYVVATAGGSSPGVFDLTPQSFAGGVTLAGTITTGGATGSLSAADIKSWDITVDQVTTDVFNRGNSTLLDSLVSISPDGRDLQVMNPDGYLTFSKGALGRHPYALQIADFTGQSPPGGQAAYYQGSLASYTLDLNARLGAWNVTGAAAATSELSTWAMFAVGFAGVGFIAYRRRERFA